MSTGIGLLLSVYLWSALSSERAHTQSLRAQLADKEADLASCTALTSELDTTLSSAMRALAESVAEKAELSEDLEDEKGRNEEFEDQIKDITSTVDKLDKLSEIDTELLKKYSKVYFLNEHYVPPKVTAIAAEYLYNELNLEYIHDQVQPFLEDLIADAQKDDIDLWVVSAYRSYDEQHALKGAYTVQYGEGANTFSADQGFSEHQLGTAVDFTTTGLGGGLSGFGDTEAYTWMQTNAYKHGFILSYPKGNEYYVYEPWHWRFVGTKLARHLHKNNLYFYDMDQRDIDAYLIEIFD